MYIPTLEVTACDCFAMTSGVRQLRISFMCFLSATFRPFWMVAAMMRTLVLTGNNCFLFTVVCSLNGSLSVDYPLISKCERYQLFMLSPNS